MSEPATTGCLGVLGGSEQAVLLAVPGAELDGALGTPAGLEQLGEAAPDLQHRLGAGEVVVAAVGPRVVVRAELHDLSGMGCASGCSR